MMETTMIFSAPKSGRTGTRLHRVSVTSVILTALLLTMFAAVAAARQPRQPDVWKPLTFFLGKWEGGGDGRGGRSSVKMEFGFLLQKTYMEVKSTYVYEPSPKKPQGEIHEELGILSFDRSRQRFVLHQFHVEDYADYLLLEERSADSKTFVFVTERIVNLPGGFRSRITYRIVNDDEFEVDWEVAGPGADFLIHSRSRLKRQT